MVVGIPPRTQDTKARFMAYVSHLLLPRSAQLDPCLEWLSRVCVFVVERSGVPDCETHDEVDFAKGLTARDKILLNAHGVC